MKLKASVILIVLISFVVSAQVTQKEQVDSDSVEKILKESSRLFTMGTEEKGVYLLNKAEKYANASDDPYLKLETHQHLIDFYLKKLDTVMVNKYLDKNLKIINSIGDKRQLGLYYEVLGVHLSVMNKKEEEFDAYKTAEALLSVHGKMEDQIDINYNLCGSYIRLEDWDAAIRHGLKAIQALDQVDVKQDRRRFLYLFMAEIYTKVPDYDKALHYFSELEKFDISNSDDLRFLGKYYAAKGDYYQQKGDYKQAAIHYKQSSLARDTLKNIQTRAISTALALSNRLNLQEEENKRIKLENTLKEEQITSRGYIILLGVVVILGLVFLAILQFRASSYKTKVNKVIKSNYDKLVKANEEVDKALKVKSDFLDAITHELLTPLNTIKGTTFLLQKNELSNQLENQVKLIDVSSEHLLNLITGVIHFNELEKGKAEFKREKFNLKTLINNLIDSSSLMNENQNVVHKNIDPEIPDAIYGDVFKTSQVFLNVFENALKFTKKGNIYIDVLLLSIDEHRVKITFSIKDTGIGMSEKQINKAFKVFSQGSVKINREYGGTGLGLSIAKKILRLNGNDISLKSKMGKGTSVFYVMDFDLYGREEEIEAKMDTIIDDFNKEIRILLVEDNKVNQLMTKKILDDYGFICETSNDGEEAVAMIKENNYCLVLMDIMMPVMDGFEATKQIKKLEPDIPVIALTAISEELHKERFNELGIYTVLNKPVTPVLLYQTIVNHCSV